MRNTKRKAAMLLALLLCLPLSGYAAEYEPILTPEESCDHVWTEMRHIITYENGETVTVRKTTRELVVSFGDYHEVFYYAMHECTLCAIQQELPLRVKQAHCYKVEEWHLDEINADVVHVTYNCSKCDQTRKESLSIAVVQGADGASAAVNCLQGAACPERTVYDVTESWYFVMPEGGHYKMVRVQLEEDGRRVSRLAERQHCTFCGRPQMCLIDMEVSAEVYASLPEFTYDQFMSYDTDLQAPYRLVDMLRELVPTV